MHHSNVHLQKVCHIHPSHHSNVHQQPGSYMHQSHHNNIVGTSSQTAFVTALRKLDLISVSLTYSFIYYSFYTQAKL